MHRNSCNLLHGWETDAYLLAVTRPVDAAPEKLESVERIFVAGGSYLRRNGKVILDSLSKVETVFTIGRPEVEIGLSSEQPIVHAAYWNSVQPQSWQVNGRQVSLDYDPATGLSNYRRNLIDAGNERRRGRAGSESR